MSTLILNDLFPLAACLRYFVFVSANMIVHIKNDLLTHFTKSRLLFSCDE